MINEILLLKIVNQINSLIKIKYIQVQKSKILFLYIMIRILYRTNKIE